AGQALQKDRLFHAAGLAVVDRRGIGEDRADVLQRRAAGSGRALVLLWPLARLLLVVLYGPGFLRRRFGSGLVLRPALGKRAFLRQVGRSAKRKERGDKGEVAKGKDEASSRLRQSEGKRLETDLVAANA